MRYLIAPAILIAGLASPESVLAQATVYISGACVDDQLLVTYPPKPKYQSVLVRATLEKAKSDPSYSSTRVAYDMPILGGVRAGVSKIALAPDRLWVVGPGHEQFHSIPIVDLHYFEDTDWAAKRERAKFGGRTGDIGGPYGYWVSQLFFSDTFESYGKLLNAIDAATPLKDWERPTAVSDYTSAVPKKAFYDLIPMGKDTFTLVHHSAGMVHVPKDSLVFQEMKLGTPHGDKKNEWITRLPDRKPQVVKAPFEGDFWAYEVGGTYFLLTRKGKLYAVKFNKDTMATSTVWQDEKRPLIGAIQDVDWKCVYAFGVDGKDGERFAFELGLEPKVTKYKTDAKVGDGFKEAQDAVRAMKPKAEKK